MKSFHIPMHMLLASSVIALSIHSALAAGNPNVEHEVQALLQKMEASGGKPIETLSPVAARKVLANAQSSVKLTLPKADVSEKTIKTSAGEIKLTIVRPAGVAGVLPAFMFFHGGGWVLGDFPTHERFVRDLVVESGAVAVFVNYTPSPEAKYPVAIDQAYAATKWVAENGKDIKVDGTRLAVAGNSVGGNMATVVALMAKEKGGPKLRAEILFWPVMDAKFDTPSYSQFAEGHFLTRNMMKWFWDNYTTDAAKRKEITASPGLATIEQLKGLPPTLIQTAENDVLRDEGEAYGRKLDAAGVAVTSVRYNGMIHDFDLLNALSTVPAVGSSLEQAGQALKKHLK
jgi:acetyl esterase/lipase